MKKTILFLLFSMTLFAQAPTPNQYGTKTPTLFPWNGTNKIDVRGRLKLDTTAGGFIPAVMTTTQRLAIGSPSVGESVYDVTEGKYYHWNGMGWVVSGGGGTQDLNSVLNEGNESDGSIILENTTHSHNIEPSAVSILNKSTTAGVSISEQGVDIYTINSSLVVGIKTDNITETYIAQLPNKTGGANETFVMQSDLIGIGAPTLPEQQIAVGQTGDAFGSSSNLTFDSNSNLRIVAPASPTGGITVSDGYINTNNVGLYSLSSDETIADYSPITTIYNYSNGNYNYNDSTTTHNFIGTVKIGGAESLTTTTGQAIDSDLTDIASLAPPNDNILQRKAGAWTSRTPAQFKTDLSLAKGDVGLSNADNTSDANKPVSTATQTALDLKANLANPTFTGTVAGITKSMVGLGNVDNTSDVNKPVSTAVSTEYNSTSALTFSGPIDLSKKGGSYYAEHTQTGAITFSVSATTVGGLAQVTILANGSAITLVGGWINVGGEPVSTTNGTTNYMVIWQTNNKVFYSVKVY
jgi:hypothetical protein